METRIDSGVIRHVFTDTRTGREISSFEFNPADLSVAVRCREVVQWCNFQMKGIKKNGFGSVEQFVDFNAELERKIAYIVGCDVKDIFGTIPGITLLPSGEYFAAMVLNSIKATINKEKSLRDKQREQILKKYVGEYKTFPEKGLEPGQEI